MNTIPLNSALLKSLLKNDTIIMKKKRKPSYKVGDVIGIKEAWQLDCHYRVQYKLDTETGNITAASNSWNYANNMPEEHIRYYAEITDIQQMTQREFIKSYGRCILYNKIPFFYSDCIKLKHCDWFMAKLYEEIIIDDQKIWVIQFKKVCE